MVMARKSRPLHECREYCNGRKELNVSTVLSVNWPGFFAYLGSAAVVTLIVLSIAYVQLWRHRIHRIRRAARESNPRPLPRVKRDVQPKLQSEERIHEYLVNADFSNEGNPNFGWKDRFLERSF